MENPEVAYFLESERIYLREVRPADVNEDYYRWMNDPQVTAYLESRFFPNSAEKLISFVEMVQTANQNAFFAIVQKKGSRHIGNIKLGPIDWIHRLADVALIIGAKECWGKGLGSEAIRLVSDYAFSTLNLHKLTSGCYEINTGSLKAFQKAGYIVEGICKNHYFCKGEYVGRIMLAKCRD